MMVCNKITKSNIDGRNRDESQYNKGPSARFQKRYDSNRDEEDMETGTIYSSST